MIWGNISQSKMDKHMICGAITPFYRKEFHEMLKKVVGFLGT